MAVLTILTHHLSDFGFTVIVNDWYFLISSFSFFTSLMLCLLLIYLFEGPRATRTALYIILSTSALYVGIVYLLSMQADTSNWVIFDYEHLYSYFWSVFAIIIDTFIIASAWELLGKVKKMPIYIKIFLVVFGTLFIDNLIYATAVFSTQPIYFSILTTNTLIRLFLSLIATPFIAIYLNAEKFEEDSRKKPKNFWEIFNFHSDLEIKIKTMEDMIKAQKVLEDELKKSEERYHLALQGANAGIWDWDVVKDSVTYSSRFFSMLGLKENEIAYNLDGFKKILHPDDIEKTFSIVNDSLNNKKTYSTEFRLRNSDGTYRWYLSSGITKYDDADKPIRMVGSIIDINERKLISQSYEEKVQELEKLNKVMVNREIKISELKDEIKKLTGEGNK